jgi:hypothetical protein
MIEHEDDELRAGFDALRVDDRAGAPAFAMLAPPREDGLHPPVRVALWAAAAAIVLVGGGALIMRPGPVQAPLAAPNTHVSITTWKSPTRGLLVTSGTELLAPKPLLSSVLGDMTLPPTPRKGD